MMSDLTRVLIFGSIVTLILSILILRSVQVITGTLAVILFSVLFVFGIQGRLGVSTDSAYPSLGDTCVHLCRAEFVSLVLALPQWSFLLRGS